MKSFSAMAATKIPILERHERNLTGWIKGNNGLHGMARCTQTRSSGFDATEGGEREGEKEEKERRRDNLGCC